MKRVKHIGLKFSASDIYSLISKQTKCTKQEVRDVFDVYREIIMKIFDEREGQVNKIELPSMGYFYFKNKHGAKAGTYRIPAWRGREAVFITKDKDDPDYVTLAFAPYMTIKKFMKDTCQGKLSNGEEQNE